MDFDIIDYMSGLTGYTFDRAVLNRIALERGVSDVESFEEITNEKRDLLLADELLVAYQSPDTWASSQLAHGSYKSNVGAQSINPKTRQSLYNQIRGIYEKYGDDKLELLDKSNGCLEFVDLHDDY